MKRIRRMSVNLGLKKLEKRVDPSDGNAYTREEFIEAYGGTDEWDAAAPGSGGADDDEDWGDQQEAWGEEEEEEDEDALEEESEYETTSDEEDGRAYR